MQLITVAGPPASGKTSVLLKTIGHLKEMNYHVGIVKFDCLQTEDDELFRKNNITARKGLSMELCPDHFFITNMKICVNGEKIKSLMYCSVRVRVYATAVHHIYKTCRLSV